MHWARLIGVGLLGGCAGTRPAGAGEQAGPAVVVQPAPIITELSPAPNLEPRLL